MGVFGSRVVTTSGKVKNTGVVKTNYTVRFIVDAFRGTNGFNYARYTSTTVDIILDPGAESAVLSYKSGSFSMNVGDFLDIFVILDAVSPQAITNLDNVQGGFIEG